MGMEHEGLAEVGHVLVLLVRISRSHVTYCWAGCWVWLLGAGLRDTGSNLGLGIHFEVSSRSLPYAGRPLLRFAPCVMSKLAIST